MATIDEIILREFNPFDRDSFKSGNFWLEENQDNFSLVQSIHQQELVEITKRLKDVIKDQKTRSILLTGDPGSGKSYFLARLKKTLNDQAFFVYIRPWIESNYVWRHVLRNTVDSLMNKPNGQEESQLMLWLKGLSIFKNKSLIKKLLGERQLFIHNFKSAYPSGIYQAQQFFGVLYDLTNPELYLLACDWLRGENLDQEDLKKLGVKNSIDSEDAAQNILANFGRISTSTHPIVLCFDQAENLLSFPNGLHSLFSLNTTFHNEYLKNFLIIISITTSQLQQNKQKLQQSDFHRIQQSIPLKNITLEQAEALWISRLSPLHAQASPKPSPPTFPLTRQDLAKNFPGGKTNIRTTLYLGERLYLDYKLELEKKLGLGTPTPTPTPPPSPSPTPSPAPTPTPTLTPTSTSKPIPIFKLIWFKEFKTTQEKVNRIRQFSSPELVAMLRQVLATLQVAKVSPNFLPSPTYTNYSFSYQSPENNQKIGLIWTEEPNMTSFYHVMQSCQKAVQNNLCHKLYLIRGESPGQSKNKGYTLYQEIFKTSNHKHFKPTLDFLHYLVTYERLRNSVLSGELIVGNKVINVSEYNSLIRESEVLQECLLLQSLGIIIPPSPTLTPPPPPVKEYLINIIKTQQMIGVNTLWNNLKSNFPLNETDFSQLIKEICEERIAKLLNGKAPIEAQLICYIPQS